MDAKMQDEFNKGYEEAIEAFEHLQKAYQSEVDRKVLKIIRKYLTEETHDCTPAYIEGFTKSLILMEVTEDLKFTTPIPMPQPDLKAPNFCPSEEKLLDFMFKAPLEDAY